VLQVLEVAYSPPLARYLLSTYGMEANPSGGNSQGTTNGPLRRLESWVCALQRIVDVLIIIGAQALAHALYPEPWSDQTTTITVIALLVFGFASEMGGLYRPWRTGTILQESKDALIAWLAVPVALFAFWFFTKTASHYSRIASFAWFALTPLLLCAVRIGARSIVMRILRIRGRDLRRVGILGCTRDAERLTEAFETMPWLGLKLAGVYDDRAAEDRRDYVHQSPALVRDRPLRGPGSRVPRRQNRRGLRRPAATGGGAHCGDSGGIGRHHRDRVLGSRPPLLTPCSVRNGARSATFRSSACTIPPSRASWAGSSASKIWYSVVSFVLLTAIPMLCIAMAIKIKSPGPIFFQQWRYGLCGKKIRILKFRTMTVCEDGPDVVQVVKDDVRVTKLGKFLRRTSLDEFPQFLQVLTGELSLVGPRPHAVAHNEKYRAIIHGYMLAPHGQAGNHGLGASQRMARGDREVGKMEERVRHDMEYIRKWNLLLDLKIIFLTVFGAKKSLHAC
jgi:putative colanic acid biosynthesis UDP-glucose lipid carrier transferase